MSTPVWQPGYSYAPGFIVQPASVPSATLSPPTNPGFESGDTGWTKGAGFSISSGTYTPYTGTWALHYEHTGSDRYTVNTNDVAVTPGTKINAQCQVRGESGHSSRSRGAVVIAWYDASDILISYSTGNWMSPQSAYGLSVVAGTAPAGAAFARIGCVAHTEAGYGVTFDAFTWDALEVPVITGLVFKAVQAVAGRSGTSEPTWPTVAGNTVVDNEVTWQAVYVSRVVWRADPIMTSGSVEPSWPSIVGANALDNNIVWEAISGRVTDSRCPHSRQVAIAANKVFAADGDVVGFCATANPLDWSTADDAGYLPFGMHAYGDTPCSALGLYRSNLIAFSSNGYQMWQVDEDPANMAMLDAVPVDCPYNLTLQPVSGDLVFLSQLGVRNIGIAGANANLQAGYFGKPIDALVSAAWGALVDYEPISLYWPAAGQYWLIFNDGDASCEAFVLTINGGPKDMSWSRYTFPFKIDDWALLDGSLYLRGNAKVYKLDDTDTIFEDNHGGSPPVPISGRVYWPYLDCGRYGVEKQLEGVDVTCDGATTVQVAWDETDDTAVTTDYSITQGDTLPGNLIPIPLTAPSFQLRLGFGGDASAYWEWTAAALYLTDNRRTP